MTSLSKWHMELTGGVGKCSVPMWAGGCPAGFCDEPAFGNQEPGQTRYVYDNGKTPRYCGGLACYAHGGPKAPEKAPMMDPIKLATYIEQNSRDSTGGGRGTLMLSGDVGPLLAAALRLAEAKVALDAHDDNEPGHRAAWDAWYREHIDLEIDIDNAAAAYRAAKEGR